MLLIAGLILLLAGGSWFPGAATVGLILTIVGVPVAVYIAWAVFFRKLWRETRGR